MTSGRHPDRIIGLYWIELDFCNPKSDWAWIGLNFRGIADRIGLNLDRFFFNPNSFVYPGDDQDKFILTI